MILLVLVAVTALVAVVWLGRNPRALKQSQWRPALGVLALALVVAAAAFGVRGGWLPAMGLLLGGLALGGVARTRLPPRRTESVSDTEARSILGVGPAATEAEIKEAYARLIRRTHPDAGGSAGLAAQLNAARDRLLRS